MLRVHKHEGHVTLTEGGAAGDDHPQVCQDSLLSVWSLALSTQGILSGGSVITYSFHKKYFYSKICPIYYIVASCCTVLSNNFVG
jgi:hypothetical protein